MPDDGRKVLDLTSNRPAIKTLALVGSLSAHLDSPWRRGSQVSVSRLRSLVGRRWRGQPWPNLRLSRCATTSSCRTGSAPRNAPWFKS